MKNSKKRAETMNTKIFKVIFGIGIFGAGVIFGKQFQKSSHRKRTTYAGTLQVYEKNGTTELYLALEVPPETLVESADVIFKIHKIA